MRAKGTPIIDHNSIIRGSRYGEEPARLFACPRVSPARIVAAWIRPRYFSGASICQSLEKNPKTWSEMDLTMPGIKADRAKPYTLLTMATDDADCTASHKTVIASSLHVPSTCPTVVGQAPAARRRPGAQRRANPVAFQSSQRLADCTKIYKTSSLPAVSRLDLRSPGWIADASSQSLSINPLFPAASVKGEDARGELKHCQIVLRILLPTNEDGAITVYAAECLLDDPSPRFASTRQSRDSDSFIFLLGDMNNVSTFEEWFVNDAADGFNIMPPYLPGGLDDFVELVVPELRRRGPSGANIRRRLAR